MKYLLVALAGLLFSVGFAGPALAAPVVPEDLFHLTLIEGCAVARWRLRVDGNVALQRAEESLRSNDRPGRRLHGRTMANITGKAGDGDYDWMPDGASFVFVRHGQAEAAALSLHAGDRKVVQLTHIAKGVSSPIVSHDGKRHRAHGHR